MGVPTSGVYYTSATTGRGDHEVHKVHVVALKRTSGRLHNEAAFLNGQVTELEEL
jgi:hypothetical protein